MDIDGFHWFIFVLLPKPIYISRDPLLKHLEADILVPPAGPGAGDAVGHAEGPAGGGGELGESAGAPGRV